MKDFDENLRRLAAAEASRTPEGFASRQRARIAALPARRRHSTRYAVALAAAVALALTTALAAALGAFDFLKARTEYAHLELAERYAQYAEPIGRAGTDGPFTFTVDQLALDGASCTVFYQITSTEPLPRGAASADYYDAALLESAVSLDLSLRGQDGVCYGTGNTASASADWGTNQTYYADAHTLYGVNRLLLDSPVPAGVALTLDAAIEVTAAPDERRAHAFSLPLGGVQPLETHTVPLGVSGPADDGFGTCVFTLDRLTASPLGCYLTVIEDIPAKLHDTEARFTMDYRFALRDGVGRDIPYSVARVELPTRTRSVYLCELLGDWQDLRDVELIPIARGTGAERPALRNFPLNGLPGTVEAEAGGFVIESVRRTDTYLEFTCRPQGLQSALQPPELRLCDSAGQEIDDFLFSGFVSRRDGAMTVRFDRARALPDETYARITQVRAYCPSARALFDQAFTAPA